MIKLHSLFFYIANLTACMRVREFFRVWRGKNTPLHVTFGAAISLNVSVRRNREDLRVAAAGHRSMIIDLEAYSFNRPLYSFDDLNDDAAFAT